MASRITFRFLLALTLSAACGAQNAPSPKPADTPCPAANQNSGQSAAKPCTPPPANANKPSAAEQFPFPGEASQPAKAPDVPNTPTPDHPSAATDHPYPGDPAAVPPDSSSSSSSSSNDGDDPSAPIGPPLEDKGTTGMSTRRKLPKVKKVQTDDERVDEDIRVAKFYLNDDNLAGAYLRAKDAVKVQPDYSETHFILAKIAQKLKKKDEAIAEYSAYLKMDPNGDEMKAAQRALAELK